MGIFYFTITESDCEGHYEFVGLTVEIQTTHTPAMVVDRDSLKEWTIKHAIAVLTGEWSRNDLLEYGVHMRILSGEKELMDTIRNRE